MDGGRKCEYGEGRKEKGRKKEGRKKKKNEEDCGKVRNVRSPGQDNGVGVGEALKKSPMG
jgi:hypothetical protein